MPHPAAVLYACSWLPQLLAAVAFPKETSAPSPRASYTIHTSRPTPAKIKMRGFHTMIASDALARRRGVEPTLTAPPVARRAYLGEEFGVLSIWGRQVEHGISGRL